MVRRKALGKRSDQVERTLPRLEPAFVHAGDEIGMRICNALYILFVVQQLEAHVKQIAARKPHERRAERHLDRRKRQLFRKELALRKFHNIQAA